ncbi:hypothetical protein F5Y01DRAFT_328880 [Xylaria sp. FL0043]|nr:hypothetical protein F5Y01DRAFT_328880 [Xylaria sp. FL0043]
MSPSLAFMPNELLHSITSLLLLPDQAALARTCKALNSLLTPIVWSDIELHHSGTHEGIDIEAEIDSLDYRRHKGLDLRSADEAAADPEYPYQQLVYEPSPRKYAQRHFDPLRWEQSFKLRRWGHCGRATNNCNRRNFQFGREEKLVGVRKITSKERWAELAQHVRSLCMSIGVDDEVAEVIASFTRLRSLELIGLPLENGHPPTAPEVKLPELQNLRLRGYFSAALVRKICDNAEQITHLDLGLLATPTDDKAYEDTLLRDDNSWAIVTEAKAERYQQNGAEALAIAAQNTENSEESDSDGGDEDDQDDEDEDSDEEGLPWALHAPIWLPRSLPPRFTALTHLHLVKPSTGTTMPYLPRTTISMANGSFEHIPHRYEQVLCLEWVSLLEAVGGTLKELILEHRVPMEVGDTVTDGDSWPERKGSEERGDELFCRSVLRLLIGQRSRFQKLEHLALRGIDIKGIPLHRGSVDIPGRNGVPDNDEELRRLYPQCDIELFEKVYGIHVYAGWAYQHWPESRHEAMQDEGDGLMWDLSFYNDYKKRFGPQWRIAN